MLLLAKTTKYAKLVKFAPFTQLCVKLWMHIIV